MKLTKRSVTLTLGLAATLLFVIPLSSSTTVQQLCAGILPPNNINIPVGAKVRIRGVFANSTSITGGITETDFNDVLDKVDKVYSPIITKMGGKFKISRNWKDGTVNAYADRAGGTWNIYMFGGLARHPLITKDGFALVACHEIGHHIGGLPKYEGGMNVFTSEGGADYFGSLKCLRNYFAGEDNASKVDTSKLDQLVIDRCTKYFAGADDKAMCMRSAMAGQSLANLLADLGGSAAKPKFNTPDPSVVSKTYTGHPKAQCRLDTYFNGTTCFESVNTDLNDKDYKAGSCFQPRDTDSFRPLCWFKPS